VGSRHGNSSPWARRFGLVASGEEGTEVAAWDGDSDGKQPRHLRARRNRQNDDTGISGDFDEIDVAIPGARAREREADAAARKERIERHRRALLLELGKSALPGLAVMGMWLMGDPGQPDTLAGDFVALLAARTTEERERASTALARYPELVTRHLADPNVRRRVAAFEHSPIGRHVRATIFPMILRYAVRLGWEDVVADTDPDAPMDAHDLARRLRTSAMAYVTILLDQVARSPELFAGMPEPGVRPSQREFLVAETLVKAFPRGALRRRWRLRMATMLACTPEAVWARRARQSKRQVPHQGRASTIPRT
jgi:hypothetical protein